MKKTRTVYTLTNIIFGFLNKIINIIFPFLIRSVIIYVLGTEYLGLNTLFSSILQILNLAEMGMSSAIVYSMYKPMAENNIDEVCALLSLYKKIYRIIGILVLTIGICIVPFLPNLIHGTYPANADLVLLYMIYLINTSLSYFFFAYKTSIWNASQQSSMVYKVNTIIIVLQSIIQILVLIVFKNYLLFLIIMPIFTLINNLTIGLITRKRYPQFICRGNVAKDVINTIKRKVMGLFITRICTTTRNALDSVFISAMLGLNMVAIYGNYYYIMAAVFSFTGIIITSMTSSVGNSMVKETPEKNFNDMRKFDFIFSWIAGICAIALLCLYQPFMKIWVGQNMLLPYHIVILFCVYFYTLCMGSIRSAYHDAAGLWWEARYRAILETIMNVGLNYILIKFLGVAGTIISTILSILIINFGYGTSIVFKHYFKNSSMKIYFIDHFKYTFATIFVAFITFLLSNFINYGNIIDIVLRGIICLIVPNILFYFIFKNNTFFKQSISMIKDFFNKKSSLNTQK